MRCPHETVHAVCTGSRMQRTDCLEHDMNTQVIETTLGELISAIRDAALEAHVAESDVAELTKVILDELLPRAQS